MHGDHDDDVEQDGERRRGNNDFLLKVLIPNALLFFLVFGLSASVDIRDVRSKFKKKTGIIVGLCCQFFLLPLIGAMVCMIGGLPPIVGIPLLVVTSSPGGSYSNLWCSLFNADLALSVAMTTVSTILSMGFLPLNLFIWITICYGESVGVPWSKLFVPLAVVVFAILGGLILSSQRADRAAGGVRSLNPNAPAAETKGDTIDWSKVLNKVGNLSGVALIIYSTLASLSGGRDSDDDSEGSNSWFSMRPGFFIAVMTPCLLGVIAAFTISSIPCFRLVGPERTAVSIECCYQNVAIAQTVAFGLEDTARAIKVPVFYAAVEIVALFIFVMICWQMNWTYAPRTDSFWKIIKEDYQSVQRKAKHKMWARRRIEKLLKQEAPGEEGPLAKVKPSEKFTDFKNAVLPNVPEEDGTEDEEVIAGLPESEL